MSDQVMRLNYGLYAERMRDLGLTQGALADLVGVSAFHLSNVATGKARNISATLAFRLAGALGVEVADLFSLVDPDAAPRPKGGAAGARVDLALATA